MSASNTTPTFKNEANKVYGNHVSACEKSSEKKENGDTLSSPTRFSKRLREQSTSSQTTEHPVVKPHSPPKRASRYVIWRKRKRSPWYGGCKQKLIRRKVVRNDQSKKSKYFSNTKFIKTSDPLQPPQEELEPTAEPCASGSMDMVISKSVEDRRDMSGTDSSATVVSPKAIAMYNDTVADKEDFRDSATAETCHSVGRNSLGESRSNPASPSKRHLSCDISNESNCSNSVFLHSPPSSSMHISPSKRKSTMSPESPHFTRSQGSLDSTISVVKPKVLIDAAALDAFISHLVRITEDYTVEKLLQLYSVLQQCVYKHRKHLDKKELLKELERNLESFLRYKPS